MSKELSEALGEALALVEKATDRKWEHIDAGLVLHDPDVSVYCGHIATFVEDDDAEAAAASINFLRQHGPAIAAALRAVEGDAWRPIETAPKDGRLFLCWVAAERWSAEDGGGSGRGADTSDFDFGRWQSMDGHPEGGYYENMMGQIGDAQDITHWQPLEPPRLVPLDAAGSAEEV